MNLTKDEYFEVLNALENRKEKLKARYECFAKDEKYKPDAQIAANDIEIVSSALDKVLSNFREAF